MSFWELVIFVLGLACPRTGILPFFHVIVLNIRKRNHPVQHNAQQHREVLLNSFLLTSHPCFSPSPSSFKPHCEAYSNKQRTGTYRSVAVI